MTTIIVPQEGTFSISSKGNLSKWSIGDIRQLFGSFIMLKQANVTLIVFRYIRQGKVRENFTFIPSMIVNRTVY